MTEVWDVWTWSLIFVVIRSFTDKYKLFNAVLEYRLSESSVWLFPRKFPVPVESQHTGLLKSLGFASHIAWVEPYCQNLTALSLEP